MPFFIPAAAIGAGISLIVWGSKMFLDNDDTADDKAAEIMARIPDDFRDYIERIIVKRTGIHISFSPGTPKDVRDEIKNNIHSA
jgi:hypothetical protein